MSHNIPNIQNIEYFDYEFILSTRVKNVPHIPEYLPIEHKFIYNYIYTQLYLYYFSKMENNLKMHELQNIKNSANKIINYVISGINNNDLTDYEMQIFKSLPDIIKKPSNHIVYN